MVWILPVVGVGVVVPDISNGAKRLRLFAFNIKSLRCGRASHVRYRVTNARGCISIFSLLSKMKELILRVH
jgi:hypothetical protein